jgi:hypothetical protein
VETWDDTHQLQLALTDRDRETTSGGIRDWQEQRATGNWGDWATGTWLQQLVKGA